MTVFQKLWISVLVVCVCGISNLFCDETNSQTSSSNSNSTNSASSSLSSSKSSSKNKYATFAMAYDSGYTLDGLVNKGSGFGASLEFSLGDNLALDFDLGLEFLPVTYGTMSGFTYSTRTVTVNAMMVMGNLRYYFGHSISGFYLSCGLGIYSLSMSSSTLGAGLIIPTFLGYKIMDQKGGIFLEPYLGLAIMAGGGGSSARTILYGAKLGIGF